MCHHHHHHEHHWKHPEFPRTRFGFPLRGLLHLIILKALGEKPMRGIDVQKYIKEKFDFDIPSAAVYVILKGLEEKGLVYSKWDKDAEGSPVKLYYATGEGKDYLKDKIEAIKSLKKVLDYLTTST
ncbi:MAG: PadR family transcriptional regulator [Desulfurococcaceae archaeon]